MRTSKLSSRREFVLGTTCAALGLVRPSPLWADAPYRTPKPDESDVFFKSNTLTHLRVELTDEEMHKLRGNPRAYVHGKLVENEQIEYRDVGVKLKGAAGSFRGVDDRPAMTVNLNKFVKKQKFHGLTKIHLNNSVQDPSYIQEMICAELFLAAGVPTARGTNCRVNLNSRELGFYGLKEGYDKTFLRRYFKNPDGNLYDGGFCQEIDANLEKDTGDGPNDRSDLKALVQACREADPQKRFALLAELLDIENFISFAVMERITCHWDGYCNNRNNYRVYFEPVSKKAYFIPHGMDQMFGDINTPVFNMGGALVCTTVLQNPEWRARYRERVIELMKVLTPPDALLARIDDAEVRIQAMLKTISPGHAVGQLGQAKGFKERLVARGKTLETQLLNAVEPTPLKFDAQGVAHLPKWAPKNETADAKQEETTGPDGVKSYLLECGPSGRCIASWRTKVLLAAGTYKFQARIQTADVVPITDGPGVGVGLRVSGGQRTNKLEGTAGWQVIEHQLDVGAPNQEFELVAELRATRGKAWFDASSMKLVKVSK